MSADLSKGLTMTKYPDAVIVYRVDHLLVHGSVYVVAVDIQIGDTEHDDRIEFIELESTSGDFDNDGIVQPKSFDIPLSAFDAIAALVEQKRKEIA